MKKLWLIIAVLFLSASMIGCAVEKDNGSKGTMPDAAITDSDGSVTGSCNFESPPLNITLRYPSQYRQLSEALDTLDDAAFEAFLEEEQLHVAGFWTKEEVREIVEWLDRLHIPYPIQNAAVGEDIWFVIYIYEKVIHTTIDVANGRLVSIGICEALGDDQSKLYTTDGKLIGVAEMRQVEYVDESTLNKDEAGSSGPQNETRPIEPGEQIQVLLELYQLESGKEYAFLRVENTDMLIINTNVNTIGIMVRRTAFMNHSGSVRFEDMTAFREATDVEVQLSKDRNNLINELNRAKQIKRNITEPEDAKSEDYGGRDMKKLHYAGVIAFLVMALLISGCAVNGALTQENTTPDITQSETPAMPSASVSPLYFASHDELVKYQSEVEEHHIADYYYQPVYLVENAEFRTISARPIGYIAVSYSIESELNKKYEKGTYEEYRTSYAVYQRFLFGDPYQILQEGYIDKGYEPVEYDGVTYYYSPEYRFEVKGDSIEFTDELIGHSIAYITEEGDRMYIHLPAIAPLEEMIKYAEVEPVYIK